MGSFLSRILGLDPIKEADGEGYEPSSFSRMLAIDSKTDYKPVDFGKKYTGNKKILVICTEEKYMTMENGKKFASGNHPVETCQPVMHLVNAGFAFDVATPTGKPAALELWALPTKDNVFLELETYQPGNLGAAVVQEMSAANIFLVLTTGEIVTPALDRGTILPGVTRASVLAIVEHCAEELTPLVRQSTDNDQAVVRASSRTVTVSEFAQATECFCTGTAAELVPIRRLATAPTDEDSLECTFVDNGPVTQALLRMLRETMAGTRTVEQGWLRDPFASAQEFCA